MNELFLSSLKKNAMIKPNDVIYVAVSGGIDSVVLLDFLYNNRTKLSIELGVLHVNHMLRGNESDKDEYFVTALAKKYKIPCKTLRVAVRDFARRERLSIEDAARKCRYRAFIDLAQKHHLSKIALAHTRDDQAETILMRIIRGAGLKGFRGIHPLFTCEAVSFIRPFMALSRQDVEQYAKERKLQYRVDISNKSLAFFRNKVRHELIHLLEEEYNPQIKEALVRVSKTVSSDLNYIEEKALEVYTQVVKKENETAVIFDKEKFAALHPALQYRVFSRGLAHVYASFVCEFRKWEHIQQRLVRGQKIAEYAGKNIYVETNYRDFLIRRMSMRTTYEYFAHPEETVLIKEAGIMITVKEVPKGKNQRPNLSRHMQREVVDLDKIVFPILIRGRKNGDRFRPLGMVRDKKVKDIMIDKKIPHYLRDEIPLMCSKGTIIWGWCIGINDKVKVTAETKRCLEICATIIEHNDKVTP